MKALLQLFLLSLALVSSACVSDQATDGQGITPGDDDGCVINTRPRNTAALSYLVANLTSAEIDGDGRRGTRFFVDVPYTGAVRLYDHTKAEIDLTVPGVHPKRMKVAEQYRIEFTWNKADGSNRKIEVFLGAATTSLASVEDSATGAPSSTGAYLRPARATTPGSNLQLITTSNRGIKMTFYVEPVDRDEINF